ncbi:hypothetical protein KQX54_016498 [Cotesia glomerata]|uniref:Uncharacterized protein n=1 Tax=Cotesia glomerata TaxID=32391 RepID=A0AAV7HS78_COTGL|nr:hypothetical protein KQX54_016498 [Cotesia glomerata]
MKAEFIKEACLSEGQQCHFSETCCSKKCIHRLESKNLGGICMGLKFELNKTGINNDNVNLCLPIGTKVRVLK